MTVGINNTDIFPVTLRKMGNTLGRSRNSQRNGEGNSASTEVGDKYYQCIKCVKEVPVSSSTELEAGDHVAFRG